MGIYYTIQTKEAWERAKEKGYLIGNEMHVFEGFEEPYQWMIEQMNKRIHHDGSYPMWLWLERPDLEEEAHMKTGKEGVCLTLEIPDEKVLISDINGWYCVLNDWFCSMTSEEEEDAFEGQWSIPKERSWERIFDLELFQRSEMWNNAPQKLQGTTGKVKVSQVKEVQHFIAK